MEKIKRDAIDDFFNGKTIDHFIASASFERRCFAIVENFKKSVIANAAVFGTIDFDPIVINNAKEMALQLGLEKSKNIDLKIDDPVFSFLQMAKYFTNMFIGEGKTIVIDITTFTHEGLLMMLRLLIGHKRVEDQVFMCYVGANEYSYHDKISENKWLSKGVKNIRSIIGYPGYSDPSKKNHLIILCGFEKERTSHLIDELEYNFVSLAFGAKNESVNIMNQLINEERHSELLALYSSAKTFKISLINPEATKNEILEYVSGFKDHNIVIAPMNNKISTIGAGLAALDNTDIQLCYMQAKRYNTVCYSETSDDCFIYQL